MRAVSSDKPWACLNCKERAKDDQEFCKKCGDRLIPKSKIKNGASK